MKIIFKLIILLVSVVLGLSSCKQDTSEINWNEELSLHGRMGEAYKTLGAKDCIGKCQWNRLSPEVLAFNGKISRGTYEEFERKIDDKVTTLKINSGGGRVGVALQLANEIRRRNLDVHVDGFCISSCANYLFLAGRLKKIDGIVGFHGSAQALDEYKCDPSKDKQKCADDFSERAFFDSVGVSNILFDTTQSVDKGMQNGRNYAYYAPSSSTLAALGVNGVVGEQSSVYLDHLEQLYQKSGFLEFAVATDPNPAITRMLAKKHQ